VQRAIIFSETFDNERTNAQEFKPAPSRFGKRRRLQIPEIMLKKPLEILF
jgi:hypothetical protein